jgi:hypothetical protein
VPAPIIYPPAPIPQVLLGGSINLLAGPPNVGKTAFLANFLKRIRDGQPVFGRQPNPIPLIAILSVDRSWHQSSQLWYDLAGWPDIRHYCLQDDESFPIDLLRQRFKRIQVLKMALDRLGEVPFGTLVNVDPIAPFLGGNLLDYDACMVACTEIRRICRSRGITIIGTAHAGKQKNDKKEQYRRLQDRIVGSTAQFGYTDTQMYLASPEETGEDHYTFLWHPHHTPAETFKLGRAANGLFIPWQEPGTIPDEAPPPSAGVSLENEEDREIWDAIPENGIGFGELIVKANRPKVTVWRALRRGMETGVVLRCGHGVYKRLKPN